ncbi:MAG: hypothetical protein R3E32_08955 [Chitinophagales bacterium]
MKKFNKLTELKSVKVLTTDKAGSFKGGGGTGNGNGYPPPFGEETIPPLPPLPPLPPIV